MGSYGRDRAGWLSTIRSNGYSRLLYPTAKLRHALSHSSGYEKSPAEARLCAERLCEDKKPFSLREDSPRRVASLRGSPTNLERVEASYYLPTNSRQFSLPR